MIQKLSILVLVLSLWTCSRKEEKDGPHSMLKRVEITPFKINKIILRDTTSVKTMYLDADSGRLALFEYQEYFGKEYTYLDPAEFNAFQTAVWGLVRDPNSRVYVNPNGKASTLKEVKDRVIQCAMVEESTFDANGDETITSKFMCDSASAIHNINQIRFFESWYFDPGTQMIERELLGYSVHQWVADKMAFRELFNVFVSDEALEKARKFYFNKQAQ